MTTISSDLLDQITYNPDYRKRAVEPVAMKFGMSLIPKVLPID